VLDFFFYFYGLMHSKSWDRSLYFQCSSQYSSHRLTVSSISQHFSSLSIRVIVSRASLLGIQILFIHCASVLNTDQLWGFSSFSKQELIETIEENVHFEKGVVKGICCTYTKQPNKPVSTFSTLRSPFRNLGFTKPISIGTSYIQLDSDSSCTRCCL